MNKKSLLLHACCGPCLTACLEKVCDEFDVTILFYNPNIFPAKEYFIRLNALNEYIKMLKLNIKVIEVPYNHDEFLSEIKGFENALEGGERCEKCIYFRLKKTAELARELNFDYFGTTLTISPHKNSKFISTAGNELQLNSSVNYLDENFKKQNGYMRSVELCKIYNIYRQNYCGCEFARGHLNK